jgi:hypothetical protein
LYISFFSFIFLPVNGKAFNYLTNKKNIKWVLFQQFVCTEFKNWKGSSVSLLLFVFLSFFLLNWF